MRSDCLDIGTIQAFLDGETEAKVSLKVADHISECTACAAVLAEAEEESSMVFPLLEREFNTLVPTQRLWAKINDEIETEKHNSPFWKKLWTGIAVALSSPSIVVAASVLVVLGLFVAFWDGRQESVDRQVAVSSPASENIQIRQNPPEGPIVVPGNGTGVNSSAVAVKAPSARDEQFVAQAADYREPRRPSANPRPLPVRESVPASDYIPGEESYVKTISSLNQSVSGQKDVIMRPSERVSFERDMAVVNDSIEKLRTEVRKNPRNDSAKQVLYASYQNKIDLLNSVTQKEELMALK